MKRFTGFTMLLAGLLWFGGGCEQQQAVEAVKHDGELFAPSADLTNHLLDNGTPCAGIYPPATGPQVCWAYATVRALRYKDPAHYCSWPTNIDIPGMTIGGFTSKNFSLDSVQIGDVVSVGGVGNHVVYVTNVRGRQYTSQIDIQDANRPDGNPWNDGQILGGTLAEVEDQIDATAGPTMWRYTCTVTSSGSCGAEPPTAPVLTSPQNGVLLSILDASYFWNSSGGGCTYEIQLNDGITTYTGTTTDLFWDGFMLSRKGILHTWKVGAYRDNYGPIWSTTFSFRTPFPELYIEGSSTVPSNTPQYYCAMPEQGYTEYTYKWFKDNVQVATTECTYMSFSTASTIRLEGWHSGVLRKSATMNITIDNGGKGGVEP